jgi:hypothetical protein
MELSIPLGVSAILGVALPDLGFSAMDLVTTAPNSESGKNCANSLPDPAHPLAVKTEALNLLLPNLQLSSKTL